MSDKQKKPFDACMAMMAEQGCDCAGMMEQAGSCDCGEMMSNVMTTCCKTKETDDTESKQQA